MCAGALNAGTEGDMLKDIDLVHRGVMMIIQELAKELFSRSFQSGSTPSLALSNKLENLLPKRDRSAATDRQQLGESSNCRDAVRVGRHRQKQTRTAPIKKPYHKRLLQSSP